MMKDFMETVRSAARLSMIILISGLAIPLVLFGLMFIGYIVSQAIKLMFS